MRTGSVTAAVLFLLPHMAMAQELTHIDGAWSRYANARFGTVAEIPTDLFRMVDPPPTNGDGRLFKSQNGAELTISGSYGAITVTDNFAEYKAWILGQLQKDGVSVTYKAQGKGWVVASGTKGGDIVYVKVIEGCDAAHELRIIYPSAHKSTYDPLVGRLARSLKCIQPE